jgi:hypothetical protein
MEHDDESNDACSVTNALYPDPAFPQSSDQQKEAATIMPGGRKKMESGGVQVPVLLVYRLTSPSTRCMA